MAERDVEAPTGRPPHGRIVSLDELVQTVARLRAEGRRVVQCHGVFDLLHIGHVRHFQSARAYGDVLVVTAAMDEHVNRGPGRPRFPLALRLEALAALHSVDYVAANSWTTADEAIRHVRPDVYARGPDYRVERKLTGLPGDEVVAIEEVGGQFVVTHDISFSAASLTDRNAGALAEETRTYLTAFAQRFPLASVRASLDEVRNLRVLVVGESIIDEYSYVETIGKSSKEPLLATRHISTERFAGGALAVANNVANFAGAVDVLTVLGTRNSSEDFIRGNMNPSVGMTFVRWPGAPTIVKRRFIESYTLTKLFEVYDMQEGPLPATEAAALRDTLERRLGDYDLAIVVDFGHGMLGLEAIATLCEHSAYLALNVQSNAGNHPYNVLSRYRRANFVTAGDGEMRLDAREPRGDIRQIIGAVANRMDADQVVVTRGKYGCLTRGRDGEVVEIPSVAGPVVDRVGAGDAFLSVAALVAAAGAPSEVVGLVGSSAAAQAVATMGHQRSVDRDLLLHQLESFLL